ncbi:hypothetical protein B0H19DRAFT_1028047 [Mycena capillaripes]|nr:hypothetical protein B0H19DRAFT_1028047 [Mycena capillaripes]
MDGLPIDPTWSELGEQERVWASFQSFLEESGYMLRPRYRPGWFLPHGIGPWESETAIASERLVLDATRIADGAQVVLKIVETCSPETDIGRFLTNEAGAPAHILSVLDLLEVPEQNEYAFMVLPRMRDCCDPKFETIAEVAEFVRQVLEGLVFLHSKNIAHRDICTENLVMDASHMVPGGFHYVWPMMSSDGLHHLEPYTGDDSDPFVIKSRTQAGPIKYHFIDFDLSVHFPSYKARALVTGDCGRLQKHVPEISDTMAYDPFKVDVRLLGEMLHRDFILRYTGLDFITPLTQKLRRRHPAHRPEAAEALALFQLLISKMSAAELTEPILERTTWTQFGAAILSSSGTEGECDEVGRAG